jgi:GTP-binding protein Era
LFKSGFVAVVGRPSVGKSSLINALVGEKVSIVAASNNTTRRVSHGVLNSKDHQIIFVDTPGIYKPRGAVSKKLVGLAQDTINNSFELYLLIIDASKGCGKGDQYISSKIKGNMVVVLNKIDLIKKSSIITRLVECQEMLGLNDVPFIPVSALSKENFDNLKKVMLQYLPESHPWYPRDVASDIDDESWIGELVREYLLKYLRDELPNQIACLVTDFDWPYVQCEILVERKSQKIIILGNNAKYLTGARKYLKKIYPDIKLLFNVKVDPLWYEKLPI